MGAMANPVVKVVTPRLNTTGLTFHTGSSCSAAGGYSPAEYAASVVTAQASQVISVLRDSGHRNGDVYCFKSGHSGGGGLPGLGGDMPTGVGSSVSKVR